MNLLSVENLAKSFGEFPLFTNLSFGIDKGDKCALVAQNGSGKTTLINILHRLDIQDKGNFAYRDGINVSFLDQNPEIPIGFTIRDYIFTSTHQQILLVKEYDEMLATGDLSGARFENLMNEMEATNAWEVEARIKEVLHNLGFEDAALVIDKFSGGEKRRLALAKCLIEQPDLLFLDEPTNHLDFNMVEWLEQFLVDTHITFFLITHDRYFLDNVCDKIIELTPEGGFTYAGNYEYFLNKKAEREEQLSSTIKKAKNLFSKELEWLRRMPKARGTKSKSRIDAAHDLEKVAKSKIEKQKLDIAGNMSRLGKKIIVLENICKNFGERVILKDFTYQFQRSEKVGIVGENGAGKSTLLNIIAGFDKDYTGIIEVGDTVKIGYYTQKGLNFREDMKVIDVVKDVAEYIPMQNGETISASQMLQNFNFSPSKQYSLVSKLSGGERKRLNLVKVLMDAPNFLILDEPTNDLDLVTLAALEDYLIGFEGCVLVVSHDRYFLDRIVDHLLVYKGEGKIEDFPGSYTSFRTVQLEDRKNLKIANKSVEKTVEVKEVKSKTTLSFKEKQELESLEKLLEDLEVQKKSLESKIIESSGNVLNDLSKQLAELLNEIEEVTFKWLSLADKQ